MKTKARSVGRPLVTCAVAVPAALIAVAACTGDFTGGQQTDAGPSKSNACSNDGTDALVVGAYARTASGATLVFTEDCRLCLGGADSSGVRWSSMYSANHDSIVVVSSVADNAAFTLSLDGRALDDAVRIDAALSCDGRTPSSIVQAAGAHWERAISPAALTWDDARAYCAASGLRLPTRDELEHAAAERVFGDEGWFWSATGGEAEEREAWAVTTDGAANANRKTTLARARCVR